MRTREQRSRLQAVVAIALLYPPQSIQGNNLDRDVPCYQRLSGQLCQNKVVPRKLKPFRPFSQGMKGFILFILNKKGSEPGDE